MKERAPRHHSGALYGFSNTIGAIMALADAEAIHETSSPMSGAKARNTIPFTIISDMK